MIKKLFIFCCCVICQAQNKYPETFFTAPLDIPILLSGNFGELRSNHFHSGLDIKTQDREGLSVHSAENGAVSRIKIAHGGYGKVLYITHPNGYTSVYAHLQKFSPKIEAYVKKRQYEKETYEIELFPQPNELVVQQGEIIAYSGNTGGSSGPHLHFEIRDSQSEKPINPLLFGIPVKDTQPPSLQALYAYSLSDSSQVNKSNLKLKINFRQQKDGTYVTDTLYAEGKIGFGINVYDRQDLAANENGVYSVEMTVNGAPYLGYDFETFSFDESPLINTFIDYEHYINRGEWIQQCFILPYNTLGIYKQSSEKGVITVADGVFYEVLIKIMDGNQNATLLKIPVKGKKQPILYKKEVRTTPYFLKYNQENRYSLGEITALFPAHTFYHNFYLDLAATNALYTIHNNSVAVKSYFTLSFDISNYAAKEREKLFVARLNSKGIPIYEGNKKNGNTISARTKNLGTYTLLQDTIAPVVKPKNFKHNQWLSNYKYLSLEIKDTLSGISAYRATLNGKWILMEYEPKTRTLTYNFEDTVSTEGVKHFLEVSVLDNVSNKTLFNATFYRKL